MGTRQIRCVLVWLVLAPGPARAQEVLSDDFPGMQLRGRVETHLESGKQALEEEPNHYGLVFPIEQGKLVEFMKQIQVYWDGTGFVLGGEYGPESHGGGVLALLLDYWRAAGRPARLEDAFWFDASRRSLALEEIYRSHQRQIFLPLPGREAGEIDGELPSSPQLPRMRFRYWTQAKPVEADAYNFLGLLIALEKDPGATWRNHLQQELSVDLLLRNVRGYYLAKRDTDAELTDHSHLHLVELLLAFGRLREDGRGADQIKKRFLEVELAREAFEGEDGSEALGHYVESLGLLLAGPHVTWGPDEKQQVKGWLRKLERDRFHDLDAGRLQELPHLLKGLRLIGANQARLE